LRSAGCGLTVSVVNTGGGGEMVTMLKGVVLLGASGAALVGLRALWGVVTGSTARHHRTSAWTAPPTASNDDAERIGLAAELAVVAELKARGIPVLHNVYAKHPNGHLTQIDVLALTADGIQVVEVKGHHGVVTVSQADEWPVRYPDGSTHRLSNPVKQNAWHINALKFRFGKRATFSNQAIFTDADLIGGGPGVHRGIPASWEKGFVAKATYAAWCQIREAHAAGDQEALMMQHRRDIGVAA